MTPSTETELYPPLHAWITRADHDVEGWAPEPPLAALHCHPDLVERVTQIARPVRGTCRAWVDGRPVVHHRAGAPIACATGTACLLVRSAEPPGALAPRRPTTGLDPAWVDLDPWAVDVAFARVIDLLRMHVQRAYDRAEAGTWP